MLTGSHFKRATFVSGRSPKTIAVVASSVLGYPILARTVEAGDTSARLFAYWVVSWVTPGMTSRWATR